MRKNCQIESDVCICCKRDSKPLLWLSTQEQKKKSEKKNWQISKGKQEQSSFDFFCVPFYWTDWYIFLLYQEAFRTRLYVFGYNNLHVATAHEDLGYALYVHEYSTGDFDEAR